jgi:glycosyltransferase involved in cell wall biosynthesis
MTGGSGSVGTGDGLRIVCLITHMDRGGAQEAILRLSRQLRARGHDSEVWFLYGKTMAYRDQPHTRLLLPDAEAGAFGYLRVASRLVRMLARHRPDAVVSFLPLANVLGQAAAMAAGVRARVASQRNPCWTYGAAMRWADLAAGSIGLYSRNVANSRSVADSAARYPAGYRRRIDIVHNGIEWVPSPLGRREARDRFGLPAGVPLLLVLGRLCHQKNQALAVRALAGVPGGMLVLAGDGEDRAALEAQVRDLGVGERVRFLGSVPPAEVPHLLGAVDVFVQPSRYEGQSNALLEAMNAGLAVVASDIPSQAETLGDPGAEPAGLLVSLGDEDGWRSALASLVGSPDLRGRLGERARERARVFSVERMAEGFERVLLEVAPRERAPSMPAALR